MTQVTMLRISLTGRELHEKYGIEPEETHRAAKDLNWFLKPESLPPTVKFHTSV